MVTTMIGLVTKTNKSQRTNVLKLIAIGCKLLSNSLAFLKNTTFRLVSFYDRLRSISPPTLDYGYVIFAQSLNG